MATRIFPDLARQYRKAGISGQEAMDRALGRSPRNAPTVELACFLRGPSKNGTAIAVWFGEHEEVANRNTGELTTREKWVWLPVSLASVREADSGNGHVVTLPEWLARERGLL